MKHVNWLLSIQYSPDFSVINKVLDAEIFILYM